MVNLYNFMGACTHACYILYNQAYFPFNLSKISLYTLYTVYIGTAQIYWFAFTNNWVFLYRPNSRLKCKEFSTLIHVFVSVSVAHYGDWILHIGLAISVWDMTFDPDWQQILTVAGS